MDPLTIGLGLAAKYAPDIIRYFKGDQAGAVAGKIIDIAQTVTGTTSPQEADAAMTLDPAKAIEFKLAVMANEKEIEQMYLLDMQNARALQVAALAQEDLFSKRFVYFFAIGWSLFAMAYFAAVTFITVPSGGQRVSDTILGVLIGSILGSIFQFFFGSSRQSQNKDDTIRNLSK